jgi:hypothetical protein
VTTLDSGVPVSPALSAPTAADDARRWVVLAVLCVGLVMVGIDGTVVTLLGEP